MIRAVTRETKSGAAAGIVWTVDRSDVTLSGTSRRTRAPMAASMAAKLRSTTVRPRRP
jgi:hypothetical protein